MAFAGFVAAVPFDDGNAFTNIQLAASAENVDAEVPALILEYNDPAFVTKAPATYGVLA